jgi:NADH/F420H2 dehydrogenase subunit C
MAKVRKTSFSGEIKRKFKKGLVGVEKKDEVWEVKLEPERLVDVAKWLLEKGFSYFSFVTAVDRKKTFELFYHLVEPRGGEKVFLRTEISRRKPSISSVTSIWSGADWHEREVYDLFGISFEGHPNLKRLLLKDDFKGYPLRKDYKNPEMVKRPDYF